MTSTGTFPLGKTRRLLLNRPLLASYCQEMIHQRRRVRRFPEAERLHELRVAARRLGEALLFMEPELPAKRARAVRGRSREIRRSVGTLRNVDVTIELVARLARDLPPVEKAAVVPIIQRLRAEASILRKSSMRKGKFSMMGIRKRIGRLLAEVPRSGRTPLDARAEAFLAKRLAQFDKTLRKSGKGDPESMHRVRIAVKRYRYTLELLEKAGRPAPEGVLRKAKKVQKDLGRLRDLDVLIALLRTLKPSTAIQPLLLRLRAERRRRLSVARTSLDTFRPLRPSRRAKNPTRSAT
jgi:CHAD domain-containing protein